MAITIERKLQNEIIYPTREKWLETQFNARSLEEQLITVTKGIDGITVDAGTGFEIPDVNSKIVLSGTQTFKPFTSIFDKFYYIYLEVDRVTGVATLKTMQPNDRMNTFTSDEAVYQYPLAATYLRENTTDFRGVPIFRYDNFGKIHAEIGDECREYLLVADGTADFDNDRAFVFLPKEIEEADMQTIFRANSGSGGAKMDWRVFLAPASSDHQTAIHLAKAAQGDGADDLFFSFNAGVYYRRAFNFGYVKSTIKISTDIGGKLVMTHQTTENGSDNNFLNYQSGRILVLKEGKMDRFGIRFANYYNANPNDLNPEFLYLGIKLREL